MAFSAEGKPETKDPFFGWEWIRVDPKEAATTPKEKPCYWRERANDKSLPCFERRRCAFLLFQRHVKIGMPVSKLSKFLEKSDWVQAKRIARIDSFTGQIPVEHNKKDSVFKITVFLEKKGRDRKDFLDIYLRCSGFLTKEFFFEAIRGKRLLQWNPKILEIAFVGKYLSKLSSEANSEQERFREK